MQFSDMGWEIYPEAIYEVLKDLKEFNKPIYITENGIADADDSRRENYIKNYLYQVWRAMQEGVDVCGYFYWSTMDNFEWADGFNPRFGLLEINYQTMERKIRKSALEYAKICKNNILEI
jgi:beta-glucosidase